MGIGTRAWPRGRQRRQPWGQTVRRALLVALTLAVLAPFLFPFLWMVLGSFKRDVDYMALPPVWIFRPTFENYHKVFFDNNFLAYAWHSFVIATLATVFGLLFGIPAAYAVARYRGNVFGLVILSSRLAPGIAFLIPWFIFFVRLQLVDTYLALVATHLIVTLPVIVWMMIGFIEDVPMDIEDAARVDGCTTYGMLARVVVPIVKPGIMAASILSFIFSWNNFVFSVVLAGPNTETLPIAVSNFMSYDSINWGPLSAAAAIITLPVMVLALFAQRHIVGGLARGGVNG